MKKLFKSNDNRFICGVCGGIGEYLGVDANIVRLIFVALGFFGGLGFLLYIAGIFLVPNDPDDLDK